MFGFGRLMHLTFDVLLVSACLAGIKRSTGLSPALTRIGSKDLRQLCVTYLELGEWVMDLSMWCCDGKIERFREEAIVVADRWLGHEQLRSEGLRMSGWGG
ncbi:BZ3500_MvSof-1268-A1-R1_Chr2-1g04329 [Microbotryum saponariae]|uniref:BZ3500_MvSof-1268-A1-R1_Chr2-1g04329 protein n=1 Tax=Microbotryum saponariae TaxID=289078 RepID=A0A2X0M9F6_9BASI|nr:BZ3500_MvSof-1268-A1-R1_Chr2-1g04329 [Microbotryum saponariae]SCZ91451.1 BZ3501_MvSof-1269-A2-R1_Chr2-1g03985 [Microbotryum saponariae]